MTCITTSTSPMPFSLKKTKMNELLKVCTCCKRSLRYSQFSKRLRNRDGLQEICKECNHKYSLEHKEHRHLVAKIRNQKLKFEVLCHYGNGLLKCLQCSETDIHCLSIDHIYGGGTKHRKRMGLTGNKFYRWLQKNNYPSGYQTLCMNCQWKKRT